MEQDPELRRSFFRNLEAMGYGGATLSPDVAERLQRLAVAETGYRVPLVTMYGATETQGVTVVHWLTERVGLIGLPLPGIALKLVPNGSKLEVRVQGPTVTPGYIGRNDLTREAFDEEGFYKLGDAARFLDADRPELGLVFDGRVAEDFKLATGTWVSVGTLRAEILAAASPYLQDAVLCGHDREELGLLAWPAVEPCRRLAAGATSLADIVAHPEVREAVRNGIELHNRARPSSSTRIGRLLLMSEPPSLDAHEITDKGYVNQRATLERRRELVEGLFDCEPSADVMLFAERSAPAFRG
jgi:feruloyl-CoA synthase